jgi:putative transcriptional regulator
MAFANGQLLVATPRLADPNFARSVILVLDHDEDGALGVVINRPSELPLEAVLPGWSATVTAPAHLFHGGPVAVDSAVAVGFAAAAAAAGPGSGGFKLMVGGFGLVDLDADPGLVAVDIVGMRVFSGYAGLGAGQLEDEIEEGSWYVVQALPEDLLNPDPQTLWRRVLRRQIGDLAYVANFPDDPTMN